MLEETSQLIDFLEGCGCDDAGRYIEDVWAFDDQKIEGTHDYIQWLFPTIKSSQSNFTAPTLSETDIHRLREGGTATNNIWKSQEWFLSFLLRQNSWVSAYDHNHLRISRVIECLGIVGLDHSVFLEKVMASHPNIDQIVSQRSQDYWISAARQI